ncbi:MAG: hypothetical protein U0165_20170 [Polyangiaceae bacterium]
MRAAHSLVSRLLVGSLAWLAHGCLITSTTDFAAQPKSPPFLNGFSASPPIDEFVVVATTQTDPLSFSAQVRAEDEGEPLDAKLVIDAASAQPGLVDFLRLAPGTFNQARTISLSWQPSAAIGGQSVAPGCHTITMIVTHQYQLDSFLPADASDADQLTWWVLVGSPDDLDYLSTVTFAAAGCPADYPPAVQATSP